MAKPATVKEVTNEWERENGRRSYLITGLFQAYSNIWTFGKYEGAPKAGHDGILLFPPETPKATLDVLRLGYLKCAHEADPLVKKFEQIYKPKLDFKIFDEENYFGLFWGSGPEHIASVINNVGAVDNSEPTIEAMKKALSKGCMVNAKVTFNGDASLGRGKTKVWINLVGIQYAGEGKALGGSGGPSDAEIADGFGATETALESAGSDFDMGVDLDDPGYATDDSEIPGMGGDDELDLDLGADDELDLGGDDGELELDLSDDAEISL